ncbi:MAG: rhomboid family intramembrane serine protease [Dehalococcoidia bacterium]
MFPIRDLNPKHSATVLTLLIIAANVAVFFFWQPFGQGVQAETEFLYERAAVPCELTEQRPIVAADLALGECAPAALGQAFFPEKNLWLSVLTSMFLHAGLLHLLGNMWFLWIFGDNVEDAFGHVGFILVYVLSGIAATAGFVWLHPTETVPLIGASGAIAGVLGAYLVLFPLRPVLALLGLFVLPVPALLFIGVWFLGQFAVDAPGVAWEAHVAGFIAGVVLTLLAKPALRRSTRASRG